LHHVWTHKFGMSGLEAAKIFKAEVHCKLLRRRIQGHSFFMSVFIDDIMDELISI
jgi:hypothetical protein